MPFPYSYICDLLQELEDVGRSRNVSKRSAAIIYSWFEKHRHLVDNPGSDACAILSTLLPERRRDRVYLIREKRLEKIICNALLLRDSRKKELQIYLTPGSGFDLAECVERVLDRTPNAISPTGSLAVEDIDEVLGQAAAACRFSSPKVRSSWPGTFREDKLEDLYRLVSPRDAKWLTRLVLKNYLPLSFDDQLVLRAFHPMLPQAMKVRDEITAVNVFLQEFERAGNDSARMARLLKPQLGTKVGRQPWFKARSIEHCLDMCQGRSIRCEQKIDGEFCQIHINLSKEHNCIQIFSKSGKDSTQDRKNLHGTIRESLKLGKQSCPLNDNCILEGELVVYSTKENKVLPFHKIRKHVSRSGSFMGTSKDSQAHEHEHLMIIYYDILLVDGESLLGTRHSDRLKRLTELVTCKKGHAELVTGETIHLSQKDSSARLTEILADCILHCREGLVVKPDEPYFEFSARFRPNGCVSIKLKKEYLQGLSDVGDFAVIGASYDASVAKTYARDDIRWTNFYIACLENRDQVRAGVMRPSFRVVNVVDLNNSMMDDFMTHCRPAFIPFEEQNIFHIDLNSLFGSKAPMDIFEQPLVFDMSSFSFDKAPNRNYWSMRFPRVTKIHLDRPFTDALTFEELQEAAREATTGPEQKDSQEMRAWIKTLENKNFKARASRATSQRSTASEATPTLSQGQQTQQLDLGQGRRGSIELGVVVEFPSLQTPPRSSTCSATEANPFSPSVRLCKRVSPQLKRASDVARLSPARKRSRTDSQPAASSSSVTKAPAANSSPTARERKPLGHIISNISFNGQASSGTKEPSVSVMNLEPSTANAVSSPTRSYSNPQYGIDVSTVDKLSPPAPAATTTLHESHQNQDTIDGNPVSNNNNISISSAASINVKHRCPLAGAHCALQNTDLLLSPCIANYPWLTENLLSQHGITIFNTDPKSWKKEASDGGQRKTKTKTTRNRSRQRKICLVDRRRLDATLAFLDRIAEADLRRGKGRGQREWVSVFDWQVLKDVTRAEEMGKEATRVQGRDLWKKYFVGLAGRELEEESGKGQEQRQPSDERVSTR